MDRGESEPLAKYLFTNTAIKNALPTVSKTRFEQTLLAEYPGLREPLEQLRRQKTAQTIQTLSEIWRLNESEANSIAKKLVEIGFFEFRSEQGTYWVPFLYRDALSMVQGAAELTSEED